jgi:hypothetical protein
VEEEGSSCFRRRIANPNMPTIRNAQEEGSGMAVNRTVTDCEPYSMIAIQPSASLTVTLENSPVIESP